MNAQKLLESADATATARIAAVLPAEEEVLIRASTDLAADGRFGQQWLVATEHRVLVVPTQGRDRRYPTRRAGRGAHRRARRRWPVGD